MDDDELKQIHAEMLEITAQALGLLTAAIARQVDAQQLTTDLQRQVDAAQDAGLHPVALRILEHALTAAETQGRQQSPPPRH